MEKRLLLAIALSVLVLLAWSYLFPPPARVVPDDVSVPAAAPEVESEPSAAPAEPAEAEVPAPAEPAIAAAGEEPIVVTNALFDVQLTNRGGRVLSWRLLQYKSSSGEPLGVWPRFEDDEYLPLGLEFDDADLTARVNSALYRITREPIPAAAGEADGERVTFTWSDGLGTRVTKSLVFHHGGYLVDLTAEVVDRGRPRHDARIALGPGFSAQESRSGQDRYYYSNQAVWNRGGLVTRVKSGKLGTPGGFSGGVRWAGLEDQFFAALVLPDGDAEVAWRPVREQAVSAAAGGTPAAPVDEPILSVSIDGGPTRIYVGPKQYKLLHALGNDLDQVVYFSSYAWLAWITKHLYLALLWLNDHVTRNYGLAIMLATFVLRIALFPINQFAMVNMRRSQLQMQRLQPKIKAIRNKYTKKGKDAQSRAKMNQEMMDLYRDEGVNPAGGLTGCIPLAAQFPILIGFYNMLTVAVELRGAPFFGWIHDLSVRDPMFVTPLLMGVTMFAQQYMSMPAVKDPQQLQQQRIMMFMPVMFVVICLQMPAGLVLYWFVNNLLGIAQQWLVNRHTVRLEQ